MSRNRQLTLVLVIAIPLLFVFLFGAIAYYNDLPNRLSQHETIVLGQNQVAPGSQAALRVVVRDSKDGAPLEGASIKVSLRPAEGGKALLVYTGETGPQGAADVAFEVPEDTAPEQILVVETRSTLGSDTTERPISVQRDYRLLLTTDKPVYQPGQTIHMRFLALSTFDLLPAQGQELEVVIADGKGNKVFRKKLTTSDFGVAAADFQLASEVNTGNYKISTSLGNTSSEKTVVVEHYVLPKFSVKLEPEKRYYLPGETVRGVLQADYFFGKPVSGGQVALEGYTFDVERTTAFTLQGQTAEDGSFSYEFDLPGYIAGSDLEGGLGRFYLQASVTDQAQHTELANLSFPVSQSSLVIEAIPEGGQFRIGVENILYILTSYPDGSPAQTDLSITLYETGQVINGQTSVYGLNELRLTPQNPYQQFLIEARDQQGNTAQQVFTTESEYAEESILLRPEKPVYRVGEAMKLTILTSKPSGSVYLDIVRQGQTVSTRSLETKNGVADVVVDLTPDLFGALELHAYKILASGTITRDTRLVVVEQAEDLSLTFDPDPGGLTLRPGDPASLGIQVSGADGAGAQSALGIAIVDEAVFALAEQDPGFAKLYFLLEQELLVPKYDLHGFSVPDLLGEPVQDDPGLLTAIEGSAQASMAAAAVQAYGPYASIFSLQASSREDALQRAYSIQERFFNRLGLFLFALFALLPLGIAAVTILRLKRANELRRSLLVVLALVGLWCLASILTSLDEWYPWYMAPLQALGELWDALSYGSEAMILLAVLLALAAFIGLVLYAWSKKDALLGWAVLLTFLLLPTLIFLVMAATKMTSSPDDPILLLGLLAFLLIPLSYLLQAAGLAYERRSWAALAALWIGLFFVFGALPILVLSMSSGSMAMRNGGPQLAGLDGDMIVEEAALFAPIPPSAKGAEGELLSPESPAGQAAAGSEPPRLRQYFPETMLWLPDAVTGEQGRYQLEFEAADSITTWRITALASTQDGRLGSTTASLRVFQDFFIDLDLPVALTVGDEVAIPVGVFNYLPEAQTVRLELQQQDWFELLDQPSKEVEIAANDISVVYFRVRAVDFSPAGGGSPFQVTAWGSKMSDAIRKEVHVYPNGKPVDFSVSDRLNPGEPVTQVVSIPTEAIAGTQTLLVKIYPGILSQVVEGLDSILRMPNGCFEQTSSTTYPNVLALDYLKTTNQVSPETQFKAEEYINLGYQRLATFEVQGSGGFSLFGDAPADRMLTAYGLQEFADMSRVHDVDPALIERAAEWLMAQQAGDGSWENDRGLVHESTWSSLGDDRLPVTAYIAWSLIVAGYGDDPRTRAGIAYLREHQAAAEDPYVLALVANALVAADLDSGQTLTPATEAVLDRLAALAQMSGDAAVWPSGVATFMGSEGQTGSIETTALAALAFLRSGSHPELANAALTTLVQQKDSFGTWYNTQATVLTLKALIQSVRSGAENVDARVTLSLNGGQQRTIQVNKDNFDVVQWVAFEDVNPGKENLVDIQAEGQGNLMYQVSAGYYLPWEALPLYPELNPQELVSIDLAYDRAQLAVNDTVEVDVVVRLNQPGGTAESAMIDLGLPPGFSVMTEDLAALVARFNDTPADYAGARIERFELTGRQILLYVTNLNSEIPLEFSYRLLARFPLIAQAPASAAYDYYNPEVNGQLSPQMLTVTP
jgi:hypothetical protein